MQLNFSTNPICANYLVSGASLTNVEIFGGLVLPDGQPVTGNGNGLTNIPGSQITSAVPSASGAAVATNLVVAMSGATYGSVPSINPAIAGGQQLQQAPISFGGAGGTTNSGNMTVQGNVTSTGTFSGTMNPTNQGPYASVVQINTNTYGGESVQNFSSGGGSSAETAYMTDNGNPSNFVGTVGINGSRFSSNTIPPIGTNTFYVGVFGNATNYANTSNTPSVMIFAAQTNATINFSAGNGITQTNVQITSTGIVLPTGQSVSGAASLSNATLTISGIYPSTIVNSNQAALIAQATSSGGGGNVYSNSATAFTGTNTSGGSGFFVFGTNNLVVGGAAGNQSSGTNGYSLGNGNWWTTPVAYLRPTNSSQGIAFDLMPNWSNVASATFPSWIDICPFDVTKTNKGTFADIRSDTAGNALFGSAEIGGAAVASTYIGENGGTIGFGGSAGTGDPIDFYPNFSGQGNEQGGQELFFGGGNGIIGLSGTSANQYFQLGNYMAGTYNPFLSITNGLPGWSTLQLMPSGGLVSIGGTASITSNLTVNAGISFPTNTIPKVSAVAGSGTLFFGGLGGTNLYVVFEIGGVNITNKLSATPGYP